MQTRFGIAFVGRQGSSYLQALLNSHPEASCQGEIMSPALPFGRSGSYDVAGLLESEVHSRPQRVVGFKMPWEAFRVYPVAWDVLGRCGYRMIHLTRDNLVDQFISMMLAEINGAWRSDMGETKITRFVADMDRAGQSFTWWAGQDAMLARALKGSFPYLHLTYEQLVAGDAIGLALDFLGLGPAPLSSEYKRQRPPLRQSEIIENYAEMKAHFAGTRWSKHFIE